MKKSYYETVVKPQIAMLLNDDEPSSLRDQVVRELSQAIDGTREQAAELEDAASSSESASDAAQLRVEANLWRERGIKYSGDLDAVELPAKR